MALVPASSHPSSGADGKTVLNGAGAPSNGTGNNGDFYIDTTAHAIYGPKAAGAWGSVTSLVGPAGAGFAIGTSYLTVGNDATQSGIAMGTETVILWNIGLVVAGSDLAVHAGNAVIDVLTTGVYTFLVQAVVTAATGTVAELAGTPGLVSSFTTTVALPAAYGYAQLQLTTGPMAFTAGDQVSFKTVADNAASTGTFDIQGARTLLRAFRLG